MIAQPSSNGRSRSYTCNNPPPPNPMPPQTPKKKTVPEAREPDDGGGAGGGRGDGRDRGPGDQPAGPGQDAAHDRGKCVGGWVMNVMGLWGWGRVGSASQGIGWLINQFSTPAPRTDGPTDAVHGLHRRGEQDVQERGRRQGLPLRLQRACHVAPPLHGHPPRRLRGYVRDHHHNELYARSGGVCGGTCICISKVLAFLASG